MITQAPEKVTAALGTNATFSCRGNGEVFWEIDGRQVTTDSQAVQLVFAEAGVYVPLPTPSVSELIMTATEMNNFTRTIRCVVDPGNVVVQAEKSELVRLTVFGEYINLHNDFNFLSCYNYYYYITKS